MKTDRHEIRATNRQHNQLVVLPICNFRPLPDGNWSNVWIVAEPVDDARPVLFGGGMNIVRPIPNGRYVHAEHFRQISLEETELQTASLQGFIKDFSTVAGLVSPPSQLKRGLTRGMRQSASAFADWAGVYLSPSRSVFAC
ncbi:MAG: hypothetical protein ABSA12_05080 [Verrucomicrobiia bacterium]